MASTYDSAEKYRAHIDSILGEAGIDWKLLARGRGYASDAVVKDIGAKLRAWAEARPEDPRAKAFLANSDGFLGSLFNLSQRLHNQKGAREWNATDDDVAQYNNSMRSFAQNIGALEGDAPAAPAEAASPQDAAAQQAQDETNRINQYVDDLVKRLQAPVVDPVTGAATDSIYDTLLKTGATAGGTSAAMRGVGGPLAATNSNDVAASAALPYLMQREQLLQSALGLQSNRNMGLEGLRQGKYGLDLQATQLNNQFGQQQWNAEQNQRQGIWGALGGIGGGILGGILGQSPKAVMGGATVGSGLLAGIGSAGATPYQPSRVGPYRGGII
jgi:hypothetical protein